MLDYISLQNFKAFEQVEIELGALTLLSGLNGSGKSTILQALGLLRQSFDARFLLEGSLALNGDLVELGTGRDVLYQGFETSEITVELGQRVADEDRVYRWSAPAGSDADVPPTESRIHFIIETAPHRHAIIGHIGRKLGIG